MPEMMFKSVFSRKTVVTLDGMFSPFPYARLSEVEFLEVPDGMDAETVRAVLSNKVGGTDKAIRPERFYSDLWDLRPYERGTLGGFLRAAHAPLKANRAVVVREVQGLIVVMGYACEVDSLYVASDSVFSEDGSVQVSPAPNSTRWTLDRDPGAHFAAGKDKFHVVAYRPHSEGERELVLRHVRPGFPACTAHCLIVAELHELSGEPTYTSFEKRTPSKVRVIWAPAADVKDALRHLLLPLNAAYAKTRGAHQFAFSKGTGVKQNAAMHQARKYGLTCDIRHFYDSCDRRLVERYLKFLMPSGPDYGLLWGILINPVTGGLYQGSPVSGVLTNAIMRPSAKYLENIFANWGMEFSIYADDIAVSSDEPVEPGRTLGTIKHVFEHYKLPFEIHPDKTRTTKNNRRYVTGVRINHLNQLTVDRERFLELRQDLHHLRTSGSARTRAGRIAGRISYFLHIDESGKVERLVRKYAVELAANGIPIPRRIREEAANASSD